MGKILYYVLLGIGCCFSLLIRILYRSKLVFLLSFLYLVSLNPMCKGFDILLEKKAAKMEFIESMMASKKLETKNSPSTHDDIFNFKAFYEGLENFFNWKEKKKEDEEEDSKERNIKTTTKPPEISTKLPEITTKPPETTTVESTTSAVVSVEPTTTEFKISSTTEEPTTTTTTKKPALHVGSGRVFLEDGTNNATEGNQDVITQPTPTITSPTSATTIIATTAPTISITTSTTTTSTTTTSTTTTTTTTTMKPTTSKVTTEATTTATTSAPTTPDIELTTDMPTTTEEFFQNDYTEKTL